MKTSIYTTTYSSPVGAIVLTANEQKLTGLYNENQRHWPKDSEGWQHDDGPRFDAAKSWLDTYFSGQKSQPLPPIQFLSGTPFQHRVWHALLTIPLGETMSYGELATQLGSSKAVRAVGAAVGRNPISIIVPCHRVVGSSGSLTGYAGGLEKKRWLLEHEGVLLKSGDT
jgi:methylated-DNA-[protein]-cysteine S-methyltransferase